MAQLERSYPDAIPGAKASLDAIAAIDRGPGRWRAPQPSRS